MTRGNYEGVEVEEMDIHWLLELAVARRASDLHLKVHAVPMLRIDGLLGPIEGEGPLTSQDITQIFESITTLKQREVFHKELELDFAYELMGRARFRVNIALHRGTIALSFRCIPIETPTIEQFELPEVCKRLVLKPRGLVLVTGPTGSGKSTTLAAMINYLNERERKRVITIEDPIEFIHNDNLCYITQRDLGEDTRSFASALIHGFRQAPDVMLVGEMRDLETMATAITAAETGHLVLSTLHTIGAAATIDRIIDVFPPYQQPQIRSQLALVLEGILSQVLLPRANGSGRVAAFEILLGNYAVSNLIRDARTHEIPGLIEVSSQQGMQTLDQALEAMVRSRQVTAEEALKRAHRPNELKAKLMTGNGKGRTPESLMLQT